MQKNCAKLLNPFLFVSFFPWNRKSSSWDSWRRKSRDRRISCSLFLFGWGGTERGFTAFQRLLRSSLLSLLSWEKPFTDCHQHPMPKPAERGLQSFVGVGKAVRWMAVWYLGWDTEAHAYTWIGTLDLFLSMWHAFLLAIRVGAPGGVQDNQCAGTWTVWEMLVAPGFSCREFIFMAALHLMPLLKGAEQPVVDDMVAAIIWRGWSLGRVGRCFSFWIE